MRSMHIKSLIIIAFGSDFILTIYNQSYGTQQYNNNLLMQHQEPQKKNYFQQISFTVNYEYLTERMADNILSQIFQSYTVSEWLNLRIKKISKQQYVTVDTRILKISENKLSFLTHDIAQFSRIEKLGKKKLAQDKQIQNEKKKSAQHLISYPKFRQKYLQNDETSQKKAENSPDQPFQQQLSYHNQQAIMWQEVLTELNGLVTTEQLINYQRNQKKLPPIKKIQSNNIKIEHQHSRQELNKRKQKYQPDIQDQASLNFWDASLVIPLQKTEQRIIILTNRSQLLLSFKQFGKKVAEKSFLEKQIKSHAFSLKDKQKITLISNIKANKQIQQVENNQNIPFQNKIDKDEILLKELLRIQNRDSIKQLRINFNISCEVNKELHQSSMRNWFKEKSKQNITIASYKIDSNNHQNMFQIPGKPSIINDKKIFQKSNNYSVAFQGGGAKGLAYVGVCKSLSNFPNINNNIKNIIGSSAGGIAALALSTGIHWKEISKICSDMDQISREDKITDKYPKDKDQYGITIDMDYVQKNLKNLLYEYGILNKYSLNQIESYLKTDFKSQVQPILLQILQLQLPSIAQILQDPYNNTKCINWEGLLLHGALMKGQFLCNRAVECLAKMCIAKYKQYDDQFKVQLLDCLAERSLRTKEKIDVRKILQLLQKNKENQLQFSQKFFQEYQKSIIQIQLLAYIINSLLQFGFQQIQQIKIHSSQQQIKSLLQIFIQENNLNSKDGIQNCKTYSKIKQIAKKSIIFDKNQLKNQLQKNNRTIIIFLKQQIIKKSVDLTQFIPDYYKKQLIKDPSYVKKYHQAQHQLIKQLGQELKKITMREYYLLSGIELTLTSVDLDNRILRFLNHKTTPNLPVCIAVQMSGSFPFAFKALRWKKQWGLYYLERKDCIDHRVIIGHQFTDGGVLANLPIKYFDNKTISERYFSHRHSQSESILMGFGLDQLKEGSYQSNQEDLQKENKKKILLASYLQKINKPKSLMSKIFCCSRWFCFGTEKVKVGDLNQSIAQKIPLLRFLIKFFLGYPNADRKLNIEAFYKQIIEHDIDDINQTPVMVAINQKFYGKQATTCFTRKKFQFLRYFNQFSLIQKSSQALQQIKDQRIKLQRQITKSSQKYFDFRLADIEYQQRPINDMIRHQEMLLNSSVAVYASYAEKEYDRIKDLKQKFRITMQDGLDSIKSGKKLCELIKKNTLYQFEQTIAQNKKTLVDAANSYFLTFINGRQIISEGQNLQQQHELSLNLIRILLLALKDRQNIKINQVLTHRMAYIKTKQNHLEPTFPLQYKSQFTKELNKIYFSKLFQSYNFESISQHLQFKDIQDQFIGTCSKNDQQLKTLLNLSNEDLTQQTRNKIRVVQQQLRSKMNNFDSQFSNPKQHFVNYSMSRLTQYLFLEINSNVPNESNEQNRIRQLLKILLVYDYQQLINPNSNFGRYSFLRYQHILQFMHKLMIYGVSYDNQLEKIRYEQSFSKFLSNLLQDNNRQTFIFKKDVQLSVGKIQQKQYSSEYFNQEHLTNQIDQQIDRFSKESLYLQNLDLQMLMDFQKGNIKQFLNNFSIENESKEKLMKFILFKDREYHPQDDLSIEAQSNLLFIKNKSRQILRQYFNGQFRQSLNLIFIQEYKKQIENIQSNGLQIPLIVRHSAIRMVQIQLIKHYFIRAVRAHICNKFKEKRNEYRIFYKLQIMHQKYFEDLQYILRFIKKILYLVSKDNHQTAQQLQKVHFNILSKFQVKYDQFAQLPENHYNIENLNSTFLIDYDDINRLVWITAKISKKQSNIKKFRVISISKIIGNFFKKKYSLPLFQNQLEVLFQHYLKQSFSDGVKNNNNQIFDKTIAKLRSDDKNRLHLVLEGSGRASNYYSVFFRILEQESLYIQYKNQIFTSVKSDICDKVIKSNTNPIQICDQMIRENIRSSLLNNEIKNCICYQIKNRIIANIKQPICNQIINRKYQRGTLELITKFVCRQVKQTNRNSQWLNGQIKFQYLSSKQQYCRFQDSICDQIKDKIKTSINNLNSNPQMLQKKKLICEQIKEIDNNRLQLYQKTNNRINQLIQMQKFSQKATNQNRKAKQKIYMITCSGLHSIFGFMIALGLRLNQIRNSIVRVQNYIYQMFDSQKIKDFFQNEGINRSLSNFTSLTSSLKQELLTIFEKLKPQIKDRTSKFDYQKCIQDVYLLIQQQQSYYTQTCNRIFEKASKKITHINKRYLDSSKTRQIAKILAYNYQCSFKERHEYGSQQNQTKTLYLSAIRQFYDQFGNILSTVFCQLFTSNSPVIIDSDAIEEFTKGALIMKLYTVYKLKAFIYEKLVEANLPRNITLQEFYERCKEKIILNFTVINVSEKRMDFFNKGHTPKMPLWAAIIASSSNPIIHRDFWCERQWQQLNENKQYYYKRVRDFFGDPQTMNRKNTFYNGANYLSSLPVQLLTNMTFKRSSKYYGISFQGYTHNRNEQPKKIILLTCAFNSKYSKSYEYLSIERKWLKIKCKLVCSQICKAICEGFSSISENCKKCCFLSCCCKCGTNGKEYRQHHNKTFHKKYSMFEAFFEGIQISPTVGALNTLVECHDNLIMKQYYNRLIKLPIKFSTLNFKEIINENIYNRQGIRVLSKIAEETIIRSQEITSSFIHNYENRVGKIGFNSKWYKNNQHRFRTKFNVQIIQVGSIIIGVKRPFLKITFLNHSRWNRNEYNNFALQYSPISKHTSQRGQFIRVTGSQVLSDIQISSKILVRFCYYYNDFKIDQQKHKRLLSYDGSCVMFNQFEIDFEKIVKLSNKETYSYQFNFAWNQLYQYRYRQNNNPQQKSIFDETINKNLLRQADQIVIKQAIKEVNDKILKHNQLKKAKQGQNQKQLMVLLRQKQISPVAINNTPLLPSQIMHQPKIKIQIIKKSTDKIDTSIMKRSNFSFLLE